MNFHKGDTVMHWAYGIGQIVNLEERALSGSKMLYYTVHLRDYIEQWAARLGLNSLWKEMINNIS